MTNHLTDNNFIPNATFLSLENITLSPEQIEWAIELSQSVPTESQQWQTYLNALALAGVEQWLQKRAPELTLSNEWLPGRNESASHQVKQKRRCPRILVILGNDGKLNFQDDWKAVKQSLNHLADIPEPIGWKSGKAIDDLKTEISQALTDE
jgi:hypothetical protein